MIFIDLALNFLGSRTFIQYPGKFMNVSQSAQMTCLRFEWSEGMIHKIQNDDETSSTTSLPQSSIFESRLLSEKWNKVAWSIQQTLHCSVKFGETGFLCLALVHPSEHFESISFSPLVLDTSVRSDCGQLQELEKELHTI